MFNGNQARQRPVAPSNSSQQLACKKEGRAKDTIATAQVKVRTRWFGDAAHRPVAVPRMPARIVVPPLTKRLFFSSSRFMAWRADQERPAPLAAAIKSRILAASFLRGALST